ncbi:hypothetical protein BJ912DRAFT_973305 [Pholiota molesta]|nr:hypothetical protein BJ912DRAFT_973305 [Pholiota molesta]
MDCAPPISGESIRKPTLLQYLLTSTVTTAPYPPGAPHYSHPNTYGGNTDNGYVYQVDGVGSTRLANSPNHGRQSLIGTAYETRRGFTRHATSAIIAYPHAEPCYPYQDITPPLNFAQDERQMAMAFAPPICKSIMNLKLTFVEYGLTSIIAPNPPRLHTPTTMGRIRTGAIHNSHIILGAYPPPTPKISLVSQLFQ